MIIVVMSEYGDELRSLQSDFESLVDGNPDFAVRNEASVSDQTPPKLTATLAAFIDGQEQSCTLMITPDDRENPGGYDIALWTIVDPARDTINVRIDRTVSGEPEVIYQKLAEKLDSALNRFVEQAREAYREETDKKRV